MTKLKNKKRLSVIALVFMLVFLVGAAFAAIVADIQIRGTADVWIASPPVDVAIIDTSVEFTLLDPNTTGVIQIPVDASADPIELTDSPAPGVVEISPGQYFNVVTAATTAGFSKEITFTVNFTCYQQSIVVDFILENIGEEDAVIIAPADADTSIINNDYDWLSVVLNTSPVGVILAEDPPALPPGLLHQRVGQFTISLNADEMPTGFYDNVDSTNPLQATFTVAFDYEIYSP